MERPVVEGRLEVDQRVAGEHALGRRLADALLDAREEPARHRPADDLLGELDARARARLELDPDVAEHPVAAGLLLVAAVDLGRCRGSSRGRGPSGVRVAIAAPNLRLSRSVITATCASPIVAQDLLAGVAALDARRRLLLEHPLERRAHLVEVALRHRARSRPGASGSGKSIGPRCRAASRVVIVSPVSVTPSLATAPISPARSSAAGSCSLPWRYSSWPIRSSSPLVAVEHRALALQRPRQHAQVGQPPDERVRGGLEHPDEQLAAGRRDLDVLARLVGRGVRALLLGRGQVADDRVEQRGQADALGGRGDEHRREDRLADALVEARVELRVARSPPRRGTSRTRRRRPRRPPRAAGRGAGRPRRRARRGPGSRPPCRPRTARPCDGRGRRSR